MVPLPLKTQVKLIISVAFSWSSLTLLKCMYFNFIELPHNNLIMENINRSQKHECMNWDCAPRSSFSGNIWFGFSVLCLCSGGNLRSEKHPRVWLASWQNLRLSSNYLCDFHLRTYLCSGFLLFGADLYIIQFTRTWRRRADFRRWRREMWRTRDRQLRRRGAAKWAVSRRRRHL